MTQQQEHEDEKKFTQSEMVLETSFVVGDYKGMVAILQWIECTNSLTKEGKKAFAAKIAGISEDNFTF